MMMQVFRGKKINAKKALFLKGSQRVEKIRRNWKREDGERNSV